jgi:hypothetical protein
LIQRADFILAPRSNFTVSEILTIWIIGSSQQKTKQQTTSTPGTTDIAGCSHHLPDLTLDWRLCLCRMHLTSPKILKRWFLGSSN